MKSTIELMHLSWDDVQRLSEAVADKIMADRYWPDIVVAISRGGFAPARILCDQLLVGRMASLQVEYYSGVNETKTRPEVVLPLNADVEGLKALIVDDVSDSGASLLVARGHLADRGASEIRIATLHYKPWSSFKPDYYAEEVEAWVVYPWEPKECMLSLADRLTGEGLDPSETRKRLLEMGFEASAVERYLGFLEDV